MDTKAPRTLYRQELQQRLEYEPIALTQLRRLARALIAGRYPAGASTIERITNLGEKP